MASTNIQNANILYDFIITEQTHTNVKLSTMLSYIKVICLFNRYLSYKNFINITKNDILDYLNSLKRSEPDDPTHELEARKIDEKTKNHLLKIFDSSK
jgi:site-specific recombinase XerD